MMPAGAKRPYNDADLLAYSDEHLWYEIWTFNEAVTALAIPASYTASSHVSFATTSTSSSPPWGVNSIVPPPGAPTRPVALNNAYVEAFMAHLRNLSEFLFSMSPRPTDVVAMDFCRPGVWKPAPSARLDAAKIRVNKELAHLTSDRVSGAPARKDWNVVGLQQELKPFLRDFVAKAEVTRLSIRIRDLL